jgi:cycloeucalenol cycloisomerase
MMQRWRAAAGCLLQIPLVMFLMTHAYFLFYHALANMVLRRVSSAGQPPAGL